MDNTAKVDWPTQKVTEQSVLILSRLHSMTLSRKQIKIWLKSLHINATQLIIPFHARFGTRMKTTLRCHASAPWMALTTTAIAAQSWALRFMPNQEWRLSPCSSETSAIPSTVTTFHPRLTRAQKSTSKQFKLPSRKTSTWTTGLTCRMPLQSTPTQLKNA